MLTMLKVTEYSNEKNAEADLAEQKLMATCLFENQSPADFS